MSTVTLVKPAHIRRSAPIFYELIRLEPKGREHIFYVDKSETLDKRQTNHRKIQLHAMCGRHAIPYRLHFFCKHVGLCGFWSFDDNDLLEEKLWFDMNAAEGIYPEVNQWTGREEEKTNDN